MPLAGLGSDSMCGVGSLAEREEGIMSAQRGRDKVSMWSGLVRP